MSPKIYQGVLWPVIKHKNTPSGVILVRNITNNRSGNTITNLSRQKGCIGSRGFDDSFEVVEEEIEPAGCNQVIDEMSHAIGPYLDFVETVKTLIFIEQRGLGISASIVVLLRYQGVVFGEVL